MVKGVETREEGNGDTSRRKYKGKQYWTQQTIKEKIRRPEADGHLNCVVSFHCPLYTHFTLFGTFRKNYEGKQAI